MTNGTFGESPDETALRDLLRNAVQGVEASPGALDHLRRAILARRQHRRQALAGAAAAVVLAGMAVPALLRATETTGSAGAPTANVASSHAPEPGEDGHSGEQGGSGGGPGPQPSPSDFGPKHKSPPTGGTGGPSWSVTIRPSGTDVPTVPDCSAAQLGQGASRADAPGSDGSVYGWFRVANVSDTACTLPGDGLVQAVAQGSADSSRIQVVNHSAGDPAVGLPAPGQDVPIVLEPAENYEVAFAWLPVADGHGGCPTPTSPSASPTPTDIPTDAEGTTNSPDSSPDTPQSATDTPAPGSVTLNFTPAAGAPTVEGPVIQDVCAGMVYTNPPIEASPTTPPMS
jgi:hypothetical protein